MGAQNNIDRKVLEIFGKNGVFVEAGGSDPIDQNNTYLLELNGWKGLVVEPKLDFNEIYSNTIPNTILENYILVSNKYKSEKIEADLSHYMMGGVVNTHKLNWNPSMYDCKTLASLLKKNKIEEVDFLSLDVEGYEMEVIEGINFNDVFFHLIVIEIHEINGQKLNFDYLRDFGFTKVSSDGWHEFFINNNSLHISKFIN